MAAEIIAQVHVKIIVVLNVEAAVAENVETLVKIIAEAAVHLGAQAVVVAHVVDAQVQQNQRLYKRRVKYGNNK